MSWYKENGPFSNVVVSTRVRYARNVAGYKFPSKMTDAEAKTLIDEVSDCFLSANSDFANTFSVIRTKDVRPEELLSLFEKHLISRDLVRQKLPGACILSKDERVSVMLCEEDHIRLQVILPGNGLAEALKIASGYEALLAERLTLSRSDSLGYLTACPTNVGSGLRISAMLHLPALTMTKRIGQVLNSVGKLGLTIRGMYGEGTDAKGCLYQLSNQVTLGISDEDILKKVSSVLDQIIALEEKMRTAILSRSEADLKNRCMRAYGILKNSYALTSDEALSYLSDVRLGKALGLVDTDFSAITRLIVEGSPACMIAEQNLTDPAARDIRRAQMAKELL